MAYNNNPGRAEYTATASQTVFPFLFKVFKAADIKVYQTPAGQTPDDATDLLTLTTDYTVTINGDAGGEITLVVGASNNDKITVLRNLEITRDIEYQAQGDLTAATLNLDQEYQTYLVADRETALDRVVRFPANLQGIDIVMPSPEASKVIGWDNTGLKLENKTVGADNVTINVLNVDTKAELLLVNTSLYNTVNMRGYYSANDGGGGIFNYDASQSATNNGGTILNGWVRQSAEELNVKWFGAKGDGIADDSIAIQTAIDLGKNIYIPTGTYLIGTGLTSATEGQEIRGENELTILKANAAITVLEMKTNRYQRVRDLRVDGNSIALYGIKLNYPKCVADHVQVDTCVTSGVWIAYFSCKIQNNSRIINNLSDGVLIKDDVGVVNDIYLQNSVISGNAGNGINIDTGVNARTGFFFSNLNMEQNASLAGKYHVKVGKVLSFFATNMYHENGNPIAQSGNAFYGFASGSNQVSLKNINMGDSSATPFNYFFVLGTDGSILKNFKFSDLKVTGYGLKVFSNNIGATDYTSGVTIDNLRTDTTTRTDYASNGTGIDLLPFKSTLRAKIITPHNISVDTIVIFDEALGSSTPATFNERLSPASYDNTTGVFTVWETGLYRVSGNIVGVAPAATVHLQGAIKKGASDASGIFYSDNGDGTKNVNFSFDDTIQCLGGDTLSVRAKTSNGSTVALRIGSNITIEKIGTQFGVS